MARGKIDLSGTLEKSLERARSGEGRKAYEQKVLTSPTPPSSVALSEEDESIRSETGFGRRAAQAVGTEKFSLERALEAGTYMDPAPQESHNRPRVARAAYDPTAEILRVQFRDGTEWEYYGMSRRDFGRYRRYKSSNRFIEAVANGYPYGEATDYVWS